MEFGNKDYKKNVFWQYDGKPYLENNITKALINTIQSYDVNDRKIVFNELFGIELKDEWMIDCYLQSKPSADIQNAIKALRDDRKIFFGLCPSGRSRALSGIDKTNLKTIKESLETYYDENFAISENADSRKTRKQG